MWDAILQASAMIFIVLPIIVGATIIVGLKILKGGSSVESNRTTADETQTVQEIYKGLARMEERIDTLEAILLDRDCKEEGKK